MSQAIMGQERFRQIFLLICVIAVSIVFFRMIGSFVLALLLAAITAALCRPLQRRLAGWFGGRQGVAAVATVIIVLVLIIGPMIRRSMTYADKETVYESIGIVRSRSALPITDTELIDIAAAAIIGLSRIPANGYRMPAATGTPSAL